MIAKPPLFDLHNGGRILFAAFAFFLVATAMLLGAVIVSATKSGEKNPLRYPVPQELVGSRTLRAGDEFSVHRLKCNDGDAAVGVTLISSDWREILPNGSMGMGFPYRSGTVPLIIPAHECNERNGLNQIPLDLAPGKWQLEGLDCIVPEKRLCRPWYTQVFDVVP